MTEKMTDSYSMMEKLLAILTQYSADLNGCETIKLKQITYI